MCDFGGDFGGVSGDGYSTPYNTMGMGDVRFPTVGGAATVRRKSGDLGDQRVEAFLRPTDGLLQGGLVGGNLVPAAPVLL